MNHEGMSLRVATQATNLRGDLRIRSTILIQIRVEVEQVVEDENGMIVHMETYSDPCVIHIELKPICYTPRLITHLLRQYISDAYICRSVGQDIAIDCAELRGPFLMSANVDVIHHVRFRLPPVDTVLSRAAPEDVLQRLMDEQKVELQDLQEEKEEEETSSPSCSICLENLSEPSEEKLIKMPICLHVFHQGCIFKWLRLHNSCPLCRRVPYEDVDD